MPPRKLPRHLVWLESFVAAVSPAASRARPSTSAWRAPWSASTSAPSRRPSPTAAAPRARPGPPPPPHRPRRAALRGHPDAPAAAGPQAPEGPRQRRGQPAPRPQPHPLQLAPRRHRRGRRQAGIKLVVSFGGTFELVRQVQTRQLDLALDFTPLPPHRGVESESLLRLPFVVLAGPDSELARAHPRAARSTCATWRASPSWTGCARTPTAAPTASASPPTASPCARWRAWRASSTSTSCCAPTAPAPSRPDLRSCSPFPADLRPPGPCSEEQPAARRGARPLRPEAPVRGGPLRPRRAGREGLRVKSSVIRIRCRILSDFRRVDWRPQSGHGGATMTPTERAIARLPAHLRRYVVTQDYAAYTPRNQAVWRHILRRLRAPPATGRTRATSRGWRRRASGWSGSRASTR